MAKRSGGFPGMGGNMNQLMKQAQKMQKQMEETTKALEESTYEATAGGGVVKVVVSGNVAATNEALRKMEEDSQEKMGKVTGGLGGMGGGFPF
ncbi:MAG: YbaB/EbfC family nucleoid-associated protein [Clostridiales bacterium Nov_37_41]|nr:MAG: YbaB/EbfC family nucleoid-associated protein [Clostridiales bacterium Nov_37_41]